MTLYRNFFSVALAAGLVSIGGFSCSKPAEPDSSSIASPAINPTDSNETAAVPGATDWQARHAEVASSAEAVAKLWFEAVFRYMDPETREDGNRGLRLLSIQLKGSENWEQLRPMQTIALRMQLPEHQHIFRSYVTGTEARTNYQFDRDNWELNIEGIQQATPARAEILLKSSGATAPRQMLLVRGTNPPYFYVAHFAFLSAILEEPPASTEGRPRR